MPAQVGEQSGNGGSLGIWKLEGKAADKGDFKSAPWLSIAV